MKKCFFVGFLGKKQLKKGVKKSKISVFLSKKKPDIINNDHLYLYVPTYLFVT